MQHVSRGVRGHAASADWHNVVGLPRERGCALQPLGCWPQVAAADGAGRIPPLRAEALAPAGGCAGSDCRCRVRGAEAAARGLGHRGTLLHGAAVGGDDDRVCQPPEWLPQAPLDRLGADSGGRRRGHGCRAVAAPDGRTAHGRGRGVLRHGDAAALPTLQALCARLSHHAGAPAAAGRPPALVPPPRRTRRRLLHSRRHPHRPRKRLVDLDEPIG